MGKMKAAAQANTTPAEGEGPGLVLFGRDEGGRPHASVFAATEVELATRAAAFMAMAVLPITTDEHRAAAAELPAGRIFASGRAFVPYTREAAYKRLESFPEAFQPAPTEQAAPTHTSVPSDWATIEVGSLVLAGEGPRQGFYEGVVVDEPDEGLFLVQWRDWPHLPPFPRRREHLALLTSELSTLAEQVEEAPAEAAGAPAAEA